MGCVRKKEWEAPIERMLVQPQSTDERPRHPLGLIARLHGAPLEGRKTMSRYTIAALHPQHTCVVGYDPPLGTFFAQVWDQTIPAAEEQLVLWVGTALEEIPTVHALATALSAYAVIPPDVWRRLESERRSLGLRPNLGTFLAQHVRKEERS
jgi:hypothetical protein